MPTDPSLLQFGPQVSPNEDQGAEFPWEQTGATLIDLTPVAFSYFVNMTPLVSRLRLLPARQVAYNTFGHGVRPNQVKVMTSINTSVTTLNVDDASIFMNGDVIELPTGEHVEVTADPDVVGNNLTVARGVEATTPTAITVTGGSEPTAYLIANSRTGGEKWQRGLFPKTWADVNYIQTAQHPVEISGLFQDTSAWLNAEMSPDPLDFGRQRQLENMMQGYERAYWYGIGEAPTDTATKRAKTKGILKRLSEVGNVINQPTNYAAYKPEDMMRDLFSNINGNPNLLVMSPDFRQGIAIWKLGISLLPMGMTDFNMAIETFTIPTFGPQAVIFDPMLRKGTVAALREQDLIQRYMRLPTWWVRGKGGDTWEGDIVARLGIQVNNPELQVAVTGITGFAKS